MADFKYSAGIDIDLNVKSASSQLKELQNQLKQISNMDFNLNGLNISEEIAEASKAALELQSHLKAATNVSTGNLDFTKLNTSLKQSGISLEEYGRKLIALGPEGQKAFMSLSTAISQSEIQMTKSSKLLNTAFDNLKKTIGWQLSSSIVNSFSGSIQRAVGYAQDLNKSLTDIRIVTGASTDQMVRFAREANKTAKSLSTTTTDYTKASLIYYQQGLSDQEVKARTETTIKMANATGQSAQTVSDQMTAIWNNFDNGTKSLTHYADVMTALGAATASSTDEIAQGLQKFAAISDTVGLSYEYAATALATITSTSRESADVVGNSLKTLFTRIQGLQLGETLDDGTTLNKYSTALAKVGISIKDSSGELKDMDLILDEMGNKWETLARDEQMALAQTVAGVRQYTQLMTLMENWDSFKQNLNIANSSEGTLNKQAEIYAQSWEAASNRMRASFEGLWDNLINDDAVIGIMDFFSGVINSIDGLVSVLGGAGGALATFGGLFTRIFGDNIAKNVEDIVHDVSQLMPSYREKQKASKDELMKELGKAQNDFGVNSARGEVFKEQSKKATGIDVERQQRRELLSDIDKETYDKRKAKVDAAREAQRQAAEKIDTSAEGMADAVADNFDVLNLDEVYYSKEQYDERQKRIDELKNKHAEELSKEEEETIKNLSEKNDRSEEEEKTLANLSNRRTKEEERELKRLEKQNQKAEKDGFQTSRRKKITDIADKNEEFLKSLQGVEDSEGFNRVVKQVYGEDSEMAAILEKNLKTALTDLPEGTEPDRKILETVAKKTTDRALKQVADEIEYTSEEDPDEEGVQRRQKAAENYAQSYANKKRGETEKKNADNQVNKTEAELDQPLPSETKMPKGSWAKTLVEGAEGIMEVTAAGQAFSGVVESMANGTATLTSAAAGLAAGSFEAVSGLASLKSALGAIPKLAGIAGPLSLVITGIATLGPIIAELYDTFNTSTEEFQRSIAKSTENLQNAAKETAQAVAIIQQESETHLKTVKQIESYSQDPSTMANDIYEANKQAIDMIAKYGQDWVQGKDYTIDQDNGLIKISESSLEKVEEEKFNIAKDFERTSNLASTTEQIESGLINLAEIFNGSEGAAELVIKQYKRSFEGDIEFQQWQNYAKQLESSWGKETFAEIMKNVQQVISSQNLLDLMSQQNTKSILQEQGFNSQNTQEFKQLNQKMSELYSKEYQDTLKAYANSADTVGGLLNGIDQIDEDQKSLIQEYLESQGRQGVEKLKYRNGEIKYYSDDTEGEQSIEWEDIKRWKAEQEATKNLLSNIPEYTNKIKAYNEDYKGMSEAILSIEEFSSVAQASADSVKILYENYQQYQKGIIEEREDLITNQTEAANKAWAQLGDEEQTRIQELFGPGGIVGILGLDNDTLKNTSLETLESLQELSNFDTKNSAALKGLFDSIKNAVGETDPEALSKILTIISQMDFSQNGYLNLLNLQSILENLGYSVDSGNLPEIYAWLCKITSLGKGENFEDTATSLLDQKKALNKIKPGEAVDQETKDASGLPASNFVLDENDQWIYTGTQEDIDNAKLANNSAFAQSYARRVSMNKYFKENYKGSYTGFSNVDEFKRAINQKTLTQESLDILEAAGITNQAGLYYDQNGKFLNDDAVLNHLRNKGLIGNGEGQYKNLQEFYDKANQTTSSSAEADYFGLKQNDAGEWFETDKNGNITGDAITDFTPYMNAFNEGATSIDPEAVQKQVASITSAVEMMDVLRNNKVAGNGFFDEQGIISDEVLARLESFPPTSERAAQAYQQLEIAKRNYEDALKDNNDKNDEAAQKIYDEALANYDLATSIDAIAEARGLDADTVTYYAEQLRDSGLYEGISGKSIAEMAADMVQQAEALHGLNEEWDTLSKHLSSNTMTEDKMKALRSLGNYIDQLSDCAITAGMSIGELEKGYQKFLDAGGSMKKVLAGDRNEIIKLNRAMSDYSKISVKTQKITDKTNNQGEAFARIYRDVTMTYDRVQQAIDGIMKNVKMPEKGGIFTEDMFASPQQFDQMRQYAYDTMLSYMNYLGDTWEEANDRFDSEYGMRFAETMEGTMDAAANVSGITMNSETVTDNSGTTAQPDKYTYPVWECVPIAGDPEGHWQHVPGTTETVPVPGDQTYAPPLSNLQLMRGNETPSYKKPGGGGGGGGGGPKEPKKVANKRKSQTVKRYKANDFHRKLGEHSKKSEENKKDYLYGEQKIAQLEKINKLVEKEAHITADRIKESREYLVEDRQNLIKYMQKYGFEAEFSTDGFLANYEQVWNELYKEIAALYEDNLLTEEEEKIEEELNIKLEEMEGALEDYENSLNELLEDIEKYEESLYEIYDNKIEALEHKVEFKIELEEDDLEYLDFWIESLGDSVYNAIESIEALGAKANHLFDGLEVYKQGIEDIYALSNDPFQVWATGGLEDVLTQDQVDLLRDNRDGLADYMQQLIDLREEIKDKVIDTFNLWTERIDANIASIEHYSSVIGYFKNMVNTIGKDPFGLSGQFVNQLEQSAINQSLDYIDSQKTYYESLVEQQAKAQEELDAARARGDEFSAEHWEEVVRTTTEAMEEAQDSLLSGLDNTLTMIAEQFESAMQRAVDAFNDAIYEHGGLEGLSNDYNMIRENADLMAADYEKIYELSKLTRDINKVLDDTNIVAGKKKMNSLLKEINELQADGVELSKYDLEYLRAKYELRLAEIELENTQNSKDTVRLSKDSEGNWSYVYTQNADAVEEAEQKYEDALYEMQNLSQEYLEEMSGMMLDTSQSMMEEISALRIQDFTSYEAYQTEIKRIQDKYAQSLKFQENELNKSIQNSSDLYEQDWQAYNQATGYKISIAENWVDSFREATLGDILDIDTFMSGFSDTFLSLTDEMSAQLADAAVQYFGNVDTAMKTYGTSINQFGINTTTTIDNISQKSKTAKDDLKTMASEMSDAFKEIADYVSGWQEEFSGQIDTMLEEIKTLIQSINEAIRKSAELAGEKDGAGELIGSAEAIELLNATGLFGSWSKNGSVGIKVNGKDTNFVDYNAALIEEIDNAVARYANAKTGTEEREKLGEELKELFKRYWQFRDIVNRVYDPMNLTTNMDAPTFTSMDTGGYTGEWGNEGKMAMLHEKELVLNANDTSNFLDALNISKEIIKSMIEMNARASSLGFGALSPSNVPEWNQTLEQTVTITAEFPDVTDHNEIEEAFNNLLNTASQYANRNRD